MNRTTLRMFLRAISALIIFFLPLSAFSGDFATDLNGFRLWQFKETGQDYYGKPFQTQKNGEYSIEAFQIMDRSYLVMEVWEKYPYNIYSLQITRYPTTMLPFKGLVLGDPSAKVDQALGKPSRTKKMKDPPGTINFYDKVNYSTEIDAAGRLYSIKLYVNQEFMTDTDDNFDQWAAFKKAVLAKDVKAILDLMRPDVEIARDGHILSIKRRYEVFLAKPDSDFVQAIIGEHNSVREEIGKTEPEESMRLKENMGAGPVYKFRKGKILKEISFFPYNGKYRIYEITFQQKSEAKKKQN